jgi:hypothetical protein
MSSASQQTRYSGCAIAAPSERPHQRSIRVCAVDEWLQLPFSMCLLGELFVNSPLNAATASLTWLHYHLNLIPVPASYRPCIPVSIEHLHSIGVMHASSL